MNDDRYQLAPEVVLSRDDQAHFLTDMRSGELYALNPSAAVILDALRQGASESELADTLGRVFPDTIREPLLADIRAILATTLDAGVVRRQ